MARRLGRSVRESVSAIRSICSFFSFRSAMAAARRFWVRSRSSSRRMAEEKAAMMYCSTSVYLRLRVSTTHSEPTTWPSTSTGKPR